MLLINVILSITFIVFIVFIEVESVDYFLYFPDIIIPGAVHTIPVFVSRTPARLILSYAADTYNSSSYTIVNKYSNIPFLMDNSKIFPGTISINVNIYSCEAEKLCDDNKLSKSVHNRTYQLTVSRNSYLLKVLTNKKCYQAADIINITVFIVKIGGVLNFPNDFDKAHVKQLTSNGKVHNFVINVSVKLYKNKVQLTKVWHLNVTNQKFYEFEHKIPVDTNDGTWKIVVIFNNGQETIKHFKVISDKVSSIFKNSKIKIKVNYDDDITIVTKNIQFSVCVLYSRMRTLQGRVSGDICVKPLRPVLGLERPCVKYSLTFNGSDQCLIVKKNIELLDLRNMTYDHSADQLVITAIAFDIVSRNQKSVRYLGPMLENSKYKITFLSQLYFKANLPYYGKILISKHNGKPFTNASLLIQCNTVNFPYNWGHFSDHRSDGKGLIHFILSPPPPELTIITCDIEDQSVINDKDGKLKYYRPTITQSLEKWKSKTDEEIQLKLLNQVLNRDKNLEILTLEIQGNRRLNNDLILFSVYNGYILKTKYIVKENLGPETCEQRDDELGHYICDKITNKIVCQENWQGSNCLVPICQRHCNNGICVKPNTCVCKYGWHGEFCDKCTKSRDCIHGNCVDGNDCICKDGWIGVNCNIIFDRTKSIDEPKVVAIKRMRKRNANESQSTFIYTAKITIEIPFMVNKYYLLIQSFTKYPLSAKLSVEPIDIGRHYIDTDEIDINSINTTNRRPPLNNQCLYGQSFDKFASLVDNRFASTTKFYNSIISDQCEMIFPNRQKDANNVIGSASMSSESQVQYYDLLHSVQTIRLIPISSLNMVTRICPLWKIVEVYKSKFPKLKVAQEISETPEKDPTPNTNESCGSDDISSSGIISDITNLESYTKPYQLSSLCFVHDKPNAVSTQNLNINVKPVTLVSIAMLKFLKVNEVHQMQINVFKTTTTEPIEVELKIKALSKCANNDRLPIKILILINETKVNTINEKIMFNCSGTFRAKLTFKLRKWSKTYPGMAANGKDTITKTEFAIYSVNEGIYQQKTFYNWFCLSQKSNKVHLIIPKDLRPNDAVKFNINIENSVDYILSYIKYIFKNRKLENIIELTLQIYEMNLNKIQQKDRSHLNQSLINIKKLLITELNILRKANKLLSLEYKLSLVNLCLDIPNSLYAWKRQICDYVKGIIKQLKTNDTICYRLDNINQELTPLSLMVFLKSNRYLITKDLDFITNIMVCYQHLNTSTIVSLLTTSLKSESEQVILDWLVNKDNDEVLLALLYFHLNDKIVSKTILKAIVEKLIKKVTDNEFQYSRTKLLLLLKIFYDFETRFQNRISPKQEHSTKKELYKQFSKWTDKESIEVSLPIINTCSVITIRAKYYQNYVHKMELSTIDMVLDNNNCNKAKLIVTLNDSINYYNSLMLLYPSGWALAFTENICNMIITNDENNSTTKFDFRFTTKSCTAKELILNILKFQNVSNYHVSYGVLTTIVKTDLYLPFKVPNCGNKSKDSVYQNYIDSSESSNIMCNKENIILINFNKKEIKIDSNNAVTISNQILTDINNLEIYTIDKKKITIVIDNLFLWSLKTTFKVLCFRWKLVNNLLRQIGNNSNIILESNKINCQQSTQSSIYNTLMSSLICRDYMYVYQLRTINHNTKELQLEYFPVKCKGEKVAGIIDYKFPLDGKLGSKCLKTLSDWKEFKTKLILFSKIDLKNNQNYVILSHNHFIIQL